MSAAPYYPAMGVDPRLLPQTSGPSPYPAAQRFMPCPGNWQPWGAIHIRPVFVPLRTCHPSPKAKLAGGFRQVTYYIICKACGLRCFPKGDFWEGVTRDLIVSYCGRGVAVDDNNCYF